MKADAPASASDVKARLLYVEPGDVLQLDVGVATSVKPRYAYVLGNTGGDNPRLKLAEKTGEGRIARYSVKARELENAVVLADSSVDHFEKGAGLYIASMLAPGTIIRLSEPIKTTGILDDEVEYGLYTMVGRITGLKKREGWTMHLFAQRPDRVVVKLEALSGTLPDFCILN